MIEREKEHRETVALASEGTKAHKMAHVGRGTIQVALPENARVHLCTDARKAPRKLPLPPLWGPAARLVGGEPGSATRYSIMRSGMRLAGRAMLEPSGYRCTETAISTSADCSLSGSRGQPIPGSPEAAPSTALRPRIPGGKCGTRTSLAPMMLLGPCL